MGASALRVGHDRSGRVALPLGCPAWQRWRQMTDMLQDSGQLARVGPVVYGCADSL
jgi:hypothetical protein